MLRAVILDMDGVIVDSERQWQLAEEPFFRSIIPRWRGEHHDKIVGMSVADLYHWLAKEYGLRQSREEFLARCHDLAEEIYGRRVTCTPGLAEFIVGVKKRGLKLGVASSSPKAWVDRVIERFELAEGFDAVACADDVGRGRTKPEPDLYLLAARRLGVETRDGLAVEDSALGVRAAKAAGLRCAAFRNGHNPSQDLSLADEEFSDFGALLAFALSLSAGG